MVYVLDVGLAFILLTALYMKVIDYNNARYDIFSYGIIRFHYTGVILGVVLGIEGSLAIMFVLGKYVMASSIGAVVLFTCFCFAQLYKKRKQGTSKCHCFGKIEWLNRMPLTRNICFIALAVIRAFLPERNDTIQTSLIFLLSIIIFILCMEFVQGIIKSKDKGMTIL